MIAIGKKKFSKSAFSLIEMSIVLLIIAIVVSGMLTISAVSITNEKVRVTKERIDEIYKALGRYMLTNYRLPCPASLVLAKNTASYGAEMGSQGACSGSGVYTSSTLSTSPIYGMVPVSALGLPDEFAEDGFGGKIAYIVHKNYTRMEFPAVLNDNGFSFTTPDTSMPSVISMPSATLNNQNVFVLISFGANKYGAFNATSTQQNSSAGASTYELQNMLSGIAGSSAAFGIVAANPTTLTFTTAESDSTTFDDIVFAKTRSAMIIDFDAMFLMPCTSGGVGYVDSFYGKTQYRATACDAPNGNIIPSKKCTVFGVWVTKQSCP